VKRRHTRRKNLRAGAAQRVEPPRDGPDVLGAVELIALLPTAECVARGDTDSGRGAAAVIDENEDEDAIAQCVICIASFDAGESITRLPCSHTFHAHCIFPWLRRSRHCPLCKADIYTMMGMGMGGAVAETSVEGSAAHLLPSQGGMRSRDLHAASPELINDHPSRSNVNPNRAIAANSREQFIVVNEFAPINARGGGAFYGDSRDATTPSPFSDIEMAC
jgi:hypothetical protein